MSAIRTSVTEYLVCKTEVKMPFPIDRNGVVHASCHDCAFYCEREYTCYITGYKETVDTTKCVGHHCPFLDDMPDSY